ncbi:MAG TPA: GIY-YIG nuclease family protein [Cyclobacteriaceae bacterium]
MWIVYVLISRKSGKRYVGMTKDVNQRLAQHNAGKSKFTSGHIPWELIYQENYPTSVEARAREKYLKSAAGKRFLDKKLDAGSLPN